VRQLRVVITAIVAVSASALMVPVDSALAVSSGSPSIARGSATLRTFASPKTSPTTTTTVPASLTTTPAVPARGDLITAGPSRRECLDPNFSDTGLAAIKSAVAKFDKVTNSTVTCLSAYVTTAQNWNSWEHPWIASAQYGYTDWVKAKPLTRQIVLEVNLIPNSLVNVENPLSWEESCAQGDFNPYATVLGKSLVEAGLENSVLRLGAEMNGIWEEDYVGPTVQEQHLWAECFANEATALREAPGERFLIDWNANACVGNIPFANYYPGNAYVDIVGLDIYDVSCLNPYSRQTFQQLLDVRLGITSFEDFAAARGKPMSFPEWGLKKYPNGDDPAYIDGMGAIFDRRDVAFETYLNVNLVIRPYLPLGTQTPLALAAFKKWFGNDS
jgi:hypothetical protein